MRARRPEHWVRSNTEQGRQQHANLLAVPRRDQLVAEHRVHRRRGRVGAHAALPGAPPVETADKLHRIDPAVVRTEMEAAGFAFDGETEVLRNPADPHTALVFDPSIRGKTDQFVYRFRKPG